MHPGLVLALYWACVLGVCETHVPRSVLEGRAFHIQLLPSCQNVSTEHLIPGHSSCGDRRKAASPGHYQQLWPSPQQMCLPGSMTGTQSHKRRKTRSC